jgi:hypothetical protein
LATRPSQLRAVHAYRNRKRAEHDLPPIQYGPVPPDYCDGCRWAHPTCIRKAACKADVRVFPAHNCTQYGRPDFFTGKRKPCPNYRTACSRTWSDCPYEGNETLRCNRCDFTLPHQQILFLRAGQSGLTQLKSRRFRDHGHLCPSTQVCDSCFAELKLHRAEHLGNPMIQLMSGVVRKSRSEKRKKWVEHMKKWKAAGMAKDPVAFRARLAKYARQTRQRRLAKDPEYRKKLNAKALDAYYRRVKEDPEYRKHLAAKAKERYHDKKKSQLHPTPAGTVGEPEGGGS